MFSVSNCNCNWGTCIIRRPRAHYRVNPYLWCP